MDLFPRSEIFMFFTQWVSHPCVLKALIYKAFLHPHSFTLDINTTVSTVLPKTHKAPDSYINVSVDFGNSVGMIPLNSIVEKAEAYKPKQRITYKLIKEYILEKYSFKVHTAYIAEVKRDLGLPMYDAPNAVETLKQPRKHPTPIQVAAIKDALTYFEVIQN